MRARMSWLNALLNLIALLLWLNWRAVRLTAATRPGALTLASTLKRVEKRPVNRWPSMAGLLALLGLRSMFYWQIGPALHWTPVLAAGPVSIPFRSDLFGRILLYSFLSFAIAIIVVHLWLLLLSIVNRAVPDSDPIQRAVRLQLGLVARWPVVVQALLPILVGCALWAAFHTPFVRLGMLPAPTSAVLFWQQTLAVGVGTLLAWKWCITAVLATYIVNTYVYLGRAPLWNFVTLTARNLLTPLRWLPLGVGKADFAPIAGIALTWLASWGLEAALRRLFEAPLFR